MEFELATPVIARVDYVTMTYVAKISQKAIAAITPVVVAGLTLSFVAFGFLIMQGAVQVPFGEFIRKCLRISIISAFCLTGGLYQTQIAQAIIGLPDDMASVVLGDDSIKGAGHVIDYAAESGFKQAGDAFEKAGFMSTEGLVFALIGLIMTLATAVTVAIGAAFIIMSKLIMAVLAGLGPIFIAALLFQPTARFFELWVGQLLNYVLLVTLFAGIFTFMMELFSDYMQDMTMDGTQNLAFTLGGAVMLAVASTIVLLQIPNVASSLGGGAAISYIHEMRLMKQGAASAAQMASAGMRGLFRRGQGGQPASGLVPAAARGAKKAAGYFKKAA